MTECAVSRQRVTMSSEIQQDSWGHLQDWQQSHMMYKPGWHLVHTEVFGHSSDWHHHSLDTISLFPVTTLRLPLDCRNTSSRSFSPAPPQKTCKLQSPVWIGNLIQDASFLFHCQWRGLVDWQIGMTGRICRKSRQRSTGMPPKTKSVSVISRKLLSTASNDFLLDIEHSSQIINRHWRRVSLIWVFLWRLQISVPPTSRFNGILKVACAVRPPGKRVAIPDEAQARATSLSFLIAAKITSLFNRCPAYTHPQQHITSWA